MKSNACGTLGERAGQVIFAAWSWATCTDLGSMRSDSSHMPEHRIGVRWHVLGMRRRGRDLGIFVGGGSPRCASGAKS